MSGQYNPRAFGKAMGIFKEHLRQTCPEALEMLENPTVGFNYLIEGFVYTFLSQDRESFERLSKPSLVNSSAKATEAIEFDLKLKLKDLGTRVEHETWFEHTHSGIQVRH
jgi:hypothetical protein